MIHSFDSGLAVEIGVTDAILLTHIFYWVEKNKANKTNFNDDHYWTYNSISAFCELFPFFSKSTIVRSLKRLEDNGYILLGNYNKSGMDRTMWYTVTDAGYQLLKMNSSIYSNWINGFAQNGTTIPNNNQNKTHIYINNNNCSSEPNERVNIDELESNFEKIYAIYPKKIGKADAFARYSKWVGKSGYKINGRIYHLTNRQIYLAVKRYVDQLKEKDTDIQYYKGFDVLMGKSLLDYIDFED